jgi:hypothetical protein
MPPTFIEVAPPPLTRRRPQFEQEHAPLVLKLLARMEWVSLEKTYKTRREAVHQATRLVGFLKAIEPTMSFRTRTWKVNDRWRWAIRKVESS